MKVLKRLTSIVLAVALTLSIVTVVAPTAKADLELTPVAMQRAVLGGVRNYYPVFDNDHPLPQGVKFYVKISGLFTEVIYSFASSPMKGVCENILQSDDKVLYYTSTSDTPIKTFSLIDSTWSDAFDESSINYLGVATRFSQNFGELSDETPYNVKGVAVGNWDCADETSAPTINEISANNFLGDQGYREIFSDKAAGEGLKLWTSKCLDYGPTYYLVGPVGMFTTDFSGSKTGEFVVSRDFGATVEYKTITFDYNDGVTESDSMKVISGKSLYDHRDEYHDNIENKLSREHYSFNYWTLNNEYYNDLDAITSDITLVANWRIDQYTVYFDSDGGSKVYNQDIDYNGVATEPTAPTKAGHEFLGWYNGDTLYDFSTPVTANVNLKAHWKNLTPIYTVGETKYYSAASLNADIADGTVAEGSTIVLTGEKPDGTVVIDGKDMTIDGSALVGGIVLPDDSALVSVTGKARVNVLGTIPATGKEDTADAPIYSEGFIYLGASSSSTALTTIGSVYQAKTIADFVTAGAVVSDVISFNVTAEVAPKTGDEIAIVAKEGAASATTFNETTGLYEVAINGIYLSHAGNDLGLSVKANDTAVETKDAYSTVSYISDAAKLSGTTDTMNTLLANLVIACKYINDRGTGNKGTAINLSAEGLEWIEGAKTTTSPAAKSMTVDASAQKIRFSGAGLHVTEKLNVYVKVEPRDGATEVPAGTYIKTYINNGSGYELIDVADDSVRGNGNKQWYAYIDKLLPTQFNSDIKVELYTSEDVLAQTLVYSVNTYCSQMSSQYSDLCTAIYNYGTAAEAVQK